ncbi:MAG: threonylcarbamoyl-AMP synthase [Lachnospiraceae bacterium]|nr:threonylcarbamoyl-AMP synthase [Lachnospiraceae bacterium]
MKTEIVKINRAQFEDRELFSAAERLRVGGLVAFPTETVYGLGGNAFDETAAARIYAAKGRPSDNPLIVHIADTDALTELAAEVPDAAYRLAEAFWPGPLTMILKKSDKVPKATTGGLDTVAIRMPADEIANALIRLSGVYVAAPSANASGRPSTTKAEHVIEDLDGKIDMIIDGGASEIGLESTIVDLTGEVPLILRPGYINAEQLAEVLGEVRFDEAVLKRSASENIVAKAPGMKYRHYAPKAPLYIVEGKSDEVIRYINAEAVKNAAEGRITGILATEETKKNYTGGMVFCVGERANAASIAAGLFNTLRSFDETGVSVIYSESFADNPLGTAIMNRLLKAAGYHIIRLEQDEDILN